MIVNAKNVCRWRRRTTSPAPNTLIQPTSLRSRKIDAILKSGLGSKASPSTVAARLMSAVGWFASLQADQLKKAKTYSL
jgi:hypothetical protein